VTDPSSRDRAELARRYASHSWRELRWGFKSFMLNGLGGTSLTPQVVRVALLRAYGAEVESYAILGGHVFEGDTSNLHIGKECYFNARTFIESVAEVRIGDRVAFAMEVMVLTSDHPVGPDGRWSREAVAKPVTIGDGVWVGARATILPGVTIGEGTIIAAGAVVTKDCAPWSVYGGVPARRIRGLRETGATPPEAPGNRTA